MMSALLSIFALSSVDATPASLRSNVTLPTGLAVFAAQLSNASAPIPEPSPSPSPAPELNSVPFASDILSIATPFSRHDSSEANCGVDQPVVFLVGAVLLACLTGVLGYSFGKRRTLKLMADGSNTSSLLGGAHTPALDSPRSCPLPVIKEGSSEA